MAKIYYVGDWAVMLGPVFAETPFNYAAKGTEIFNYGTWLKAALESTGEHQCDSVPAWDFYRNPPGRWEEILEEYDVVIFSDVESKNFQLDPAFFDRSKFGKEPLTFPDRVRLTVRLTRRALAFIVEDDGPGIPSDLQDSVFYPLVTTRPEGTGLGLPAAQELLSRHGGLIEFESRPGRTVFFVRIPLEQKGSPL